MTTMMTRKTQEMDMVTKSTMKADIQGKGLVKFSASGSPEFSKGQESVMF